MSNVIRIPLEEFKLLLTLCAHDFRHDFMNTSDRVNAGFMRGFSGGAGKSLNKENNVTTMAVYLNDIFFLNSLRKYRVKQAKGKAKEQALIKAMIDTQGQFSIFIKVLNIVNNVNVGKTKRKTKRKGLLKTKGIPTNLSSITSLVSPLGAKKYTTRKTKKNKPTNKKKKSKNNKKKRPTNKKKKPMNKKKKQTTKKYRLKGGTHGDKKRKRSMEVNKFSDFPEYPEGWMPAADISREELDSEVEKLKKIKKSQDENTGNMFESVLSTVGELDAGFGQSFEFYMEGLYTGNVLYESDISNDTILSYQDYSDLLNLGEINYYIESLDTSDPLAAEHKRELEQVKTEIETKSKVRKQENLRRSTRAAAQGVNYSEPVDISVYTNWFLKYEIYADLYNIEAVNEIIGQMGNPILIPEGGFQTIGEFSTYYMSISGLTGIRRLNFNSYIAWLNKKNSSIELAIAPKLPPASAKIIKEFGRTVSKYWWSFITGEARAISPAMTPPSRPERPERPVLTETGKLLSKMLHSTFNATSNDATVLKIFKDYFNKDITFKGRVNHKTWNHEGLLINNASQLKLYEGLFGKRTEGNCFVPSVLDAMSNCPRLTESDMSDINIRVQCTTEDSYIQYNVTNITREGCRMGFEFKNRGIVIRNGIETEYRNKPLSVVNVLQYLIHTVNEALSGIAGSTIDEKVFNFNQAISMDPTLLPAAILPVFCLKLFGDLGQELFAVANDGVFVSNDRPSAMRYILMKKFKLKGGGGGYFPNTRDPYFI